MIDLPIVRFYQTPEQAGRALESLHRWGFEPERVVVLSPSIASAGADDTTLSDALRAARIPASQAAPCAAALRRGYTLVSVMAPFGTGGIAEDLLRAGEPAAFDVAASDSQGLPSDLAAPVSRTLGPPTVTDRGRTTSESLGLPTATHRGRTTSEPLGIPAVTRSDRFTFGAPRVGGMAEPLSRLLGLPVLIRD
jgi:hypothetical protein